MNRVVGDATVVVNVTSYRMISRTFRTLLVVAGLLSPAGALVAQERDTVRVHYSAKACPSCAEWNEPHAPRTLYANVHYVGTRGLSAILLTSEAGHILIDAGLPASAPQIMANVRALGFRVEDIRLVLNSHAHYDHAGGIAAIQRASGARVAARPTSAAALASGEAGRDDPQFGIALPYPPVTGTRIEHVTDGDTLKVGPLRIVAHATGGHTSGGTSWSWRSCDGVACLDFVYADSQTPVSADDFMYTNSAAYPNALSDFNTGHTTLERLPCDVIITPHPGASRLWERVARMGRAGVSALRQPDGCRRYAANARELLRQRIARETSKDTAALNPGISAARLDAEGTLRTRKRR